MTDSTVSMKDIAETSPSPSESVSIDLALTANTPTTELDANLTQLVQTWHASQTLQSQGKLETQQLRKQMRQAKQNIIKEMKRKKVTAIKIADGSYLLLFVTGHETVVKPELIEEQMKTITVEECEAAHKALVLEARKRHHDIAAKSTSAEVLKKVLKKKLRPLVYTKVENLRWATKPRRKDVVGSIAAGNYTELRMALNAAVQQRHQTLNEARQKRQEAERLAQSLMAPDAVAPKQITLTIPTAAPTTEDTVMMDVTTETSKKKRKAKSNSPQNKPSVTAKRARLLSAAAHSMTERGEGTKEKTVSSSKVEMKIVKTEKAATRIAPLKVSAAARLVEQKYLQLTPAVNETTAFNPHHMAEFLTQRQSAVTDAVQHDLKQRKANTTTVGSCSLVLKLPSAVA